MNTAFYGFFSPGDGVECQLTVDVVYKNRVYGQRSWIVNIKRMPEEIDFDVDVAYYWTLF